MLCQDIIRREDQSQVNELFQFISRNLTQKHFFQALFQEACLFILLAFKSHDQIRVNLSAFQDAQNLHFDLVLILDARKQLSNSDFFDINRTDFPSFPNVCGQILVDLNFFNLSGLTCLHNWDCQVYESVSHFFQFAFLQVLDQLDCLKCSYTTGGCWQSGSDSTGFKFCCHPVHCLKLVIWCSQICHWVNQVNVAVLIIVFFKFFCADLDFCLWGL